MLSAFNSVNDSNFMNCYSLQLTMAILQDVPKTITDGKFTVQQIFLFFIWLQSAMS